jgi:8-oxo-dGTP pyrophosphatase MutT (NUDIX family)
MLRADLVSGILPVREDGCMLLLQRPTGTWEPPAGRLSGGEGFEDGAERELYEETGLLVAPQRILATWVGEAPSGNLLAAVTYIARTRDEEVNLSHEHLGYRWVTLEEWLELPSWWSPENVRRVAGSLSALPEEPLPEPSVPKPCGRGLRRLRPPRDTRGDGPRRGARDTLVRPGRALAEPRGHRTLRWRGLRVPPPGGRGKARECRPRRSHVGYREGVAE